MDFGRLYKDKNVIVTGGASFIGSHLVDELIKYGAKVKIIDDFSSGNIRNLSSAINEIEVIELDLRKRKNLSGHFKNSEVLFHLAAIHGGRGFIETQKRLMFDNFNIDTNVFTSAIDNRTRMIVHASSACVYPVTLQEKEIDRNLLKESEANLTIQGNAFPDGVYGWIKLMGEYQLQTLANSESKGRSARIFTAYGERENLSHAAIALIAKADLKLDPFPVWGTGNQTRNFTHVSDTVRGLLYLGGDTQKTNFEVYNIGTSNHIRVIDFIKEILNQNSWEPEEWNFQIDKPVGVSSRASDNQKLKSVFGWEPTLNISEGIRKTILWYNSSDLRVHSLNELESKLLQR
jgi:nucleoside-diphosphate-sugar epimerase